MPKPWEPMCRCSSQQPSWAPIFSLTRPVGRHASEGDSRVFPSMALHMLKWRQAISTEPFLNSRLKESMNKENMTHFQEQLKRVSISAHLSDTCLLCCCFFNSHPDMHKVLSIVVYVWFCFTFPGQLMSLSIYSYTCWHLFACLLWRVMVLKTSLIFKSGFLFCFAIEL